MKEAHAKFAKCAKIAKKKPPAKKSHAKTPGTQSSEFFLASFASLREHLFLASLAHFASFA